MKKRYIIYFIISLFLGLNSINAANNQCVLENEKKWEYQTTLSGTTADNTINVGTYDHYKCCTDSSSIKVCDFYSTVKVSNVEDTKKESSNSNVNYCTGLSSTFKFIGHIVRIAKIAIPIIIIIFGAIDFFRAMVGSKDDEIKKSVRSLIFRVLAGVCIFFLPAIIGLAFSWVDGWEQNYEGNMQNCFKCIWDVGSCK